MEKAAGDLSGLKILLNTGITSQIVIAGIQLTFPVVTGTEMGFLAHCWCISFLIMFFLAS